jgi:hypothetical protein
MVAARTGAGRESSANLWPATVAPFGDAANVPFLQFCRSVEHIHNLGVAVDDSYFARRSPECVCRSEIRSCVDCRLRVGFIADPSGLE